MPHQPVEDDRRTLRPPAPRARQPVQALTGSLPLPGRSSSRHSHWDRGRAKLFVVTGPSGAGKGTLIRALVGRRSNLEVATSATTRPRRPGEEDGREYYFLSEEEFDLRLLAGEFLEHVVYVSGQRYGTLHAEVDRILGEGRSCILELETQGARAVEAARPETVSIFIATPSFAELERRLRERATESAGEIGERLELAKRQTAEASHFDYVVMNDDVERAVDELERVVCSEIEADGR